MSDLHVKRIANQIRTGKWQFNGDTIKVAKTGDVLDGQHRLWAVIEANMPIKTIIVYGIDKDAFSTIDTIRKVRTGKDVLALAGVEQHRETTASALRWLTIYQRHQMEDFNKPTNKIENSDIESMFADNPMIIRAVERCSSVKNIVNPALISFMYYVVTTRDAMLAERFISTLIDPTGTSIDDPIFRLRTHFISNRTQGKRMVATEDIALMIKALNAAKRGRKVGNLRWVSQGKQAEEFPKLDI